MSRGGQKDSQLTKEIVYGRLGAFPILEHGVNVVMVPLAAEAIEASIMDCLFRADAIVGLRGIGKNHEDLTVGLLVEDVGETVGLGCDCDGKRIAVAVCAGNVVDVGTDVESRLPLANLGRIGQVRALSWGGGCDCRIAGKYDDEAGEDT